MTTFPQNNLTTNQKTEDEPEYEDDDEEYEDEDYYHTGDAESKVQPKSQDSEKKTDITKENPADSVTGGSTVTGPIIATTTKPNRNFNVNLSPSTSKTFSQNSPSQSQQAALPPNVDKFLLTQTQNGKTVVNPSSTTPAPIGEKEKIPDGFNGRVGNRQPNPQITYEKNKYRTRFLPSKHIDSKKPNTGDIKTPDSYVTVTKSVTGSLDDSNTPTNNKEFASTYYTKSSTCGYFTFSCNIVYGKNGRSKICRPLTPANGKC